MVRQIYSLEDQLITADIQQPQHMLDGEVRIPMEEMFPQVQFGITITWELYYQYPGFAGNGLTKTSHVTYGC